MADGNAASHDLVVLIGNSANEAGLITELVSLGRNIGRGAAHCDGWVGNLLDDGLELVGKAVGIATANGLNGFLTFS